MDGRAPISRGPTRTILTCPDRKHPHQLGSMEIIAGIAIILLIIAFGAGSVWLAWDNARTRDAVDVNPRTRKALDDRLSAVEERISTITSLAEDAQSRVKSLQGTLGKNRADINKVLSFINDPEALAEQAMSADGIDPRAIEAYFNGVPIEQSTPAIPRRPVR